MIHLSKKWRYLLSILSGILMVLSFPFTGSLSLLAFVAWIPLLLIEKNTISFRHRSGRIFVYAYLTFLIYNIGTTWWIWNASVGGAILAFVLNSLLMAIAFYVFHKINKKIGSKFSLLTLLTCWIGFEYLHHNWELSWPWLTLGNAFSIRPSWIQWYSFTGVLGGSSWILLVNYFGAKLLQQTFIAHKKWQWNKRTNFFLFGSFGLPLFVSIALFQNYKELKNPLEIVAIQPNIDPYNEKFSASLENQLQKILLLGQTKITPSTALILAPETAISESFYENDFGQSSLHHFLGNQLVKWQNKSLYIGASTYKLFPEKNSRASIPLEGGQGFYENYNSSLLLNGAENYEFVHKSKLVLGVEKIPFSNWLPFLESLSIQNGGTSGTLGIENSPKILRASNFSFAPLICYESIYGEFNAEQCRKGAEIICIITNDGWWGDTPGYKQHASFAAIRAIENRRGVARSANTGISCFFNQRGERIAASKWWEPTALRQKLNRNIAQSFYTKNGDYLGKLSLLIVSILAIYSLFIRPKKMI